MGPLRSTRRVAVGVAVLVAAAAVTVAAPPAQSADQWQDLAFPARVRARALSIYGPDNAWTYIGAAVHWNGTSWTEHEATFDGVDVGIGQIDAVADAGAWAVGTFAAPGTSDESPWVGRWTGEHWQAMTPAALAPPEGCCVGYSTVGVVAAARDDVWVAFKFDYGDDGEGDTADSSVELFHYDGATWSQAPDVSSPDCPSMDIGHAAVTLRRDQPVVSFECAFLRPNGSPRPVEVVELHDGRFAYRGTYTEPDPGNGYTPVRAVGVLGRGALVGPSASALQIRGSDGTWRPWAPAPDGALDPDEQYDPIAVDANTGAVLEPATMSVGEDQQAPSECAYGGGGQPAGSRAWSCHTFTDLAGVGGGGGVAVDQLTGARWFIGFSYRTERSPILTHVYRRPALGG